MPQVEKRLLIKVEKILEFRLGPHSDVEDYSILHNTTMANNETILVEQEIEIPLDSGEKIRGTLDVRKQAKGIIIFAHGSASNRFSPRNQYVASVLQEKGFATLLFDLSDRQGRSDRFADAGIQIRYRVTYKTISPGDAVVRGK